MSHRHSYFQFYILKSKIQHSFQYQAGTKKYFLLFLFFFLFFSFLLVSSTHQRQEREEEGECQQSSWLQHSACASRHALPSPHPRA